jgi:type I restriction enzyme M protein
LKNHSEIANFLWSIADLIRDTFSRGKYHDVILPLTVLRRIDCVLAPNAQEVRNTVFFCTVHRELVQHKLPS